MYIHIKVNKLQIVNCLNLNGHAVRLLYLQWTVGTHVELAADFPLKLDTRSSVTT